MGCMEMATEGRRGVSTYIQCNNQKKNEPFVGMGTTTHPHPRRCRAPTFSSPPDFPFVLSCPGIVLSFPGPLVPPCGVVDVLFGVVGGRRGAGGWGTVREVVVVKGSGWCEEGRTMMWQRPYLVRSELGNR